MRDERFVKVYVVEVPEEVAVVQWLSNGVSLCSLTFWWRRAKRAHPGIFLRSGVKFEVQTGVKRAICIKECSLQLCFLLITRRQESNLILQLRSSIRREDMASEMLMLD